MGGLFAEPGDAIEQLVELHEKIGR
jgi:hypothetical protein